MTKPNGDYPPSWKEDLVLNNIDVARQPDFIDFLYAESGMPDSKIENIIEYAAKGVVTQKFTLESEISDLITQRAFASDMIIRSFQHDTTVILTDSIRYWVEQKNDILAEMRIIDSYLQDENFNQAEIEIDVLLNNINKYPDELRQEIEDFVTLKNLLIPILRVPGQIADLRSSDHEALQNIAQSGTGLAKYQAEEILCFFYEECAYREVYCPSPSRSKLEGDNSTVTTNTENAFKIYPNPTGGKVSVEFTDFKDNYSLEIIDVNGKILSRYSLNKQINIIELSNLPNGIYVLHITDSEGNQIGSERVVVQH